MKTIHKCHHHHVWNQSIPIVDRVEPGSMVHFEFFDASGGQINIGSSVKDVEAFELNKTNPVTGPIEIVGAEPGDVLAIDIIDFEMSYWGWTAIFPEFGLLDKDFAKPFLHISKYNDQFIEFTPEIHLPTRPFAGTIGLAPAEKGDYSILPPQVFGGNMDIRDLVKGSRLYLPVQVKGAMFSAGDTHAAQGDGEVSGTAIESPMKGIFKFDLIKNKNIPGPQFEIPFSPTETIGKKGYYVTSGVANDLMTAARDSVKAMVDHLIGEYSLSPELAYCLCGVAVDLRINEIVDKPNWIVSAYLPLSIFK